MNRFKYENLLTVIAGVLLGIIFISDVLAPLGWALYIFYFLPIAVLIHVGRSYLPIAAAIIVTIFVFLGFFLSPAGANNFQVIGNRLFSVVNVWMVAFFVKYVIMARNTVAHSNWLATGRASILEGIRGESSIHQVVNQSITALCRYLGADVGLGYVVTDTDSKLNYIAGYGAPPKDEINKLTFQFGEGSVGQTALDSQCRIINGVDGQAHLKSSLHTAISKNIAIFPLKSDLELKAVYEVGFFGDIPGGVNDLFESISEPIALAISAAQRKMRLSELLDETQRQAEELQMQQEELRVTNEELEQQTKFLKEAQSRLENNQAELEQTNQQLEEQMQELERQKAILNEKNDHLLIAQGELKKNRDDLARATKYKSEFLANMSHELRTPLNSSLILAKLLKDNKEKNLTEEQVRFADTIYSSGNELLCLINDTLDLSKIEAGKMEVHPTRVRVHSMIRSLEKSYAPVARQKELNFQIENKIDKSVEIKTDQLRLEQILKNFISNAIKFTEKGHVKLKVDRVDEQIVFEVQDTGIGIPGHQHEIIFEAFRQADGTTNRKYGGTGLGLSISRELAHLLGGKIVLRSEPGKGSVFSLYMPLEYSEAQKDELEQQSKNKVRGDLVEISPERNEDQPQDLKPVLKVAAFPDDRNHLTRRRKVLVIEDDVKFARILYDVAHEMGFDAIISTTADEGYKLAIEYTPHAIILDIRLPDHSGLTVLDQLKNQSKTRHIPVHVISAEDFSRTVLHMGAVGYNLKPVQREYLVKAFEDLESRMTSIRKVLIVEDNKTQRESLVALISGKDAEIVAVESAEQALTELNKMAFDCMIMDLTLPGMTGAELLEVLAHEDRRYPNPPIIVYTGHDLTVDEELELKRYSDSIIIKGARSPERLLSEVSLFLHRVESNLPLDRQKMLFEMRNREKTLQGRRILIVDDDVRNIFAMTSLLESQGAKIEIARNGQEALDKLNQKNEYPIDLTLMDIMMPIMDGYEATRRIRQDKKYSNMPIIAVTAKAMRDDQEKCLAAGANDYLSKPVDSDRLLSLIRVWMPPQRGL